MKKRRVAEAAEPTPATGLNIISYYRHYARRCEDAARNAPNEKMRTELSKMVPVWREFAEEHERMMSEGRDLGVHRKPLLKGWM